MHQDGQSTFIYSLGTTDKSATIGRAASIGFHDKQEQEQRALDIGQ